jgi:GNAT superfamily N-acetyltransferase
MTPSSAKGSRADCGGAHIGSLIVREVLPAEAEVLDEIGRVRVRAWRSSRQRLLVEGERWTDPVDALGRHWAAFDGSRVVAAARLSMHGDWSTLPDAEVVAPFREWFLGPVAALNRLVVLPEARRRGLPDALDHVRIEAARAQGARTIQACAVGGRAAALASCGFRTLGRRRSNVAEADVDVLVLEVTREHRL